MLYKNIPKISILFVQSSAPFLIIKVSSMLGLFLVYRRLGGLCANTPSCCKITPADLHCKATWVISQQITLLAFTGRKAWQL